MIIQHQIPELTEMLQTKYNERWGKVDEENAITVEFIGAYSVRGRRFLNNYHYPKYFWKPANVQDRIFYKSMDGLLKGVTRQIETWLLAHGGNVEMVEAPYFVVEILESSADFRITIHCEIRFELWEEDDENTTD